VCDWCNLGVSTPADGGKTWGPPALAPAMPAHLICRCNLCRLSSVCDSRASVKEQGVAQLQADVGGVVYGVHAMSIEQLQALVGAVWSSCSLHGVQGPCVAHRLCSLFQLLIVATRGAVGAGCMAVGLQEGVCCWGWQSVPVLQAGVCCWGWQDS
jgi:hypothetical protein